ncbi:Uncharacterized protein PECH_005833 [Penicillium ucsense]|uniref:Uncharacterized protein n=1 Tax=Penicillium ucsense TaxID=2839758 RepID=A0A8J8W8R3_9EURO|nr:Uncharacterized protein PECM_000752 [Penicillium ucsense]KAF7736025.1 Uncharacterized protein PECH_005833 [Penicillium ucsense]
MGSIGSALPTQASNGLSPAAPPKRLLLLSVPRTASNLFLKVLNPGAQPALKTNAFSGYFFYPVLSTAALEGLTSKEAKDWTPQERQRYLGLCQESFDNLEGLSQEATKENKSIFTKEHVTWLIDPAMLFTLQTGSVRSETPMRINVSEEYGSSRTYTQPSILPDEYLRTWQFAFTIRHPALAWPSLYRAIKRAGEEGGFVDEDGARGASLSNMTFGWTRIMYDWCVAQPDVPTPPIIDAHDLIHTPEVALKFCEQTGLDKTCLQFEWSKDGKKKSDHWGDLDKNRPDRMDAHRQAANILLGTLEASTGLMKDRTPAHVDIEAEHAKWEVEFGKEMAGLIEKAVRNSMGDYEYLRAHRMQA